MKIIAAPDSFKGSLSATEAADFIEAGIREVDPDIYVKKIPVSDGGEGFVEAMTTATGGEIIRLKVTGPLGDKIDSFFGVLGDKKTAVVEMAAAAGVELVPKEKRNPLYTTTYGVGELILAALKKGYKKIIVGAGGSITNDGGMGMAQALGISFRDQKGKECGRGGINMKNVTNILLDGLNQDIRDTTILLGSDVTNPFYGPEGAAYVYAPQKGAKPHEVEKLDQGLQYFSSIVKRDTGIDLQNIPGSGAAGGFGGGLVAFTGAKVNSGIEIVLKSCELDKELEDTSLVITGEGRTDEQTGFGKVPVGVATMAARHNVPVICLSGSLAPGYENIYKRGVSAAFSICPGPVSLEEAISSAGKFLQQTTSNITKMISAWNGGTGPLSQL